MTAIFNNKKYIIYTCISMVLLVVLLSAAFILKLKGDDRIGRLYSELGAQRWQGEDDSYAQASIFFSEYENIGMTEINEYRNSINQKLYDDAYMEKGDTTAWIDAFSGEKEIEISKGQSSLKVRAYFVGGRFFDIHPIPLKGGSYFDEDDRFSVVLDDYTAWSLFGSSDIEGLDVSINDRLFSVAGVVERSEDEVYNEAYGNYYAIYVPYEAFLTGKSEENDSEDSGNSLFTSYVPESMLPPINCYTIVAIEPITDYTLNLLLSATGLEETLETKDDDKKGSSESFGSKEPVSNTHRFELLNLYKSMGKDKYFMMKTNPLQYPYWENVARFELHRQVNRLAFITWLVSIASVILIAWIVVSIRLIVKMSPKEDKRHSVEYVSESIKAEADNSNTEVDLSPELRSGDNSGNTVTE